MKSETMECPVCGGNLSRVEREETCEYKGGRVAYMQPGWWCDSCDEAILKGEDNTVSNTVFVELRARIEGVLPPSEVKNIRKQLNLTQKQASKIFGGGANAFQKYESGETVPSVGMSLLIKLVGDHADYLESLPLMREQFYKMPFERPVADIRDVSL